MSKIITLTPWKGGYKAANFITAKSYDYMIDKLYYVDTQDITLCSHLNNYSWLAMVIGQIIRTAN